MDGRENKRMWAGLIEDGRVCLWGQGGAVGSGTAEALWTPV